MKKYFRAAYAALTILIAAATLTPASAQSRAERKAAREQEAIETARMVESLLESENFVFVPDHVTTGLRGMRSVSLTTYYELVVGPQGISSFLPYYGHAYSVPYDRNRSPLEFTARDYTYIQSGQPRGKQAATITINARQDGTGRFFTILLDVYDNGTATLRIRETGSQEMTFRGNILPLSSRRI